MKHLLEKGIVVIDKFQGDPAYFYKYYDYSESCNGLIVIEKINNEILCINYDPFKDEGTYFNLSNYQNLILICVEHNTPYKVVEYSDGMYIERKPEFKDHVISNFVKEEVYRGYVHPTKQI